MSAFAEYEKSVIALPAAGGRAAQAHHRRQGGRIVPVRLVQGRARVSCGRTDSSAPRCKCDRFYSC
jgi:hypothetical protein